MFNSRNLGIVDSARSVSSRSNRLRSKHNTSNTENSTIIEGRAFNELHVKSKRGTDSSDQESIIMSLQKLLGVLRAQQESVSESSWHMSERVVLVQPRMQRQKRSARCLFACKRRMV